MDFEAIGSTTVLEIKVCYCTINTKYQQWRVSIIVYRIVQNVRSERKDDKGRLYIMITSNSLVPKQNRRIRQDREQMELCCKLSLYFL